jgi:hypothetical protein
VSTIEKPAITRIHLLYHKDTLFCNCSHCSSHTSRARSICSHHVPAKPFLLFQQYVSGRGGRNCTQQQETWLDRFCKCNAASGFSLSSSFSLHAHNTVRHRQPRAVWAASNSSFLQTAFGAPQEQALQQEPALMCWGL